MAKIAEPTLKMLFALSRNQCAFPGCKEELVTDDNVIIGEMCHIKARSKKGPRYDDSLTEKENNDISNLLILCANHHKIVDSLPELYTVNVLKDMKNTHEKSNGPIKPNEKDLFFGKLIYNNSQIEINSVNEIKATTINTINIKKTKGQIKLAAPDNCIGSDNKMRNYVKHLIDRYQKFVSEQKDRNFNYAVIYANINRMFHSKWDMIDKEKFNDLVQYLQEKIDKTILGKKNRKNGISNYSSYIEYIAKM